MKIAFTSPLKSPLHPVPSGDRTIARLFVRALKQAGHEVRLVGTWQSRDARGDQDRQLWWADMGPRLAERQIKHWGVWRPDLVFCYHLYYKAVDWIGPSLADQLSIPYVAAEASHAPKRANGPWAVSHQAMTTILAQASAGIITINPADRACIRAATGPDCAHLDLPPFIDLARLDAARRDQSPVSTRDTLGLGDGTKLLVTVAMMRERAKLPSYRLLAEALQKVSTTGQKDWHLLICGDGPARAQVEQAFSHLQEQVSFVGAVPASGLQATLAQADLFCWPAIDEAFGMAFIEAQAAGLPVVAGLSPGVASVLAPQAHEVAQMGDGDGFAQALGRLMAQDRNRLQQMGQKARHHVEATHSLSAAAVRIDGFLNRVMTASRRSATE
ncbi:MAG: glycosyltransferase family 4 protein [Alphaproteobacteria bacterium]